MVPVRSQRLIRATSREEAKRLISRMYPRAWIKALYPARSGERSWWEYEIDEKFALDTKRDRVAAIG